MKVKIITALVAAFLAAGTIHAQAVYSNFGPGKKLDRFTAISERMRCLCGCGLVLSTCPHVNCGFGIPARRMIEFMIDAGFSDQEILDGFEKGLLSTQGPELYKADIKENPLLKSYFSSPRPVWRDDTEPQYRQLQSKLVEDGLKDAEQFLQAQTPEAEKPTTLDSRKKLFRHFRSQFRRAARIIAKADEALAGLPPDSPDREQHLSDKGMARGKLFTLASFMLGRGSRVKADGRSTTGMILSWLAGLLATGAVGFVIYRNLRRAGASETGAGAGSSSPSAGSSTGVADDDYEDQWKEWEK